MHGWRLQASAACCSAGITSPAAVEAAPATAARTEFLEAAKLTPDIQHGKELFETCAACHGQNGRGTADGSVPAIAGQHGSVLLKQLVDFRHEQRWDERMAHFTDRHHLPGAQDLTDVAAYASKLPRFPMMSDAIGDGAFLHEGASVYFRVCEACHGPLGQATCCDSDRALPASTTNTCFASLRKPRRTSGPEWIPPTSRDCAP